VYQCGSKLTWASVALDFKLVSLCSLDRSTFLNILYHDSHHVSLWDQSSFDLLIVASVVLAAMTKLGVLFGETACRDPGGFRLRCLNKVGNPKVRKRTPTMPPQAVAICTASRISEQR
jgi:hypothetical protein